MSPSEIRAEILGLQLRIQALSYRAARLKLEGDLEGSQIAWDQVEILREKVIGLQAEAREQGERN